MRIILGGVYQQFVDGSSVTITRTMSDPVPTCALTLVDNDSSITPQAMQELLILDDQVIPNPCANLILNPSMNPYTTNWAVTAAGTGRSYAQIGGGGIAVTFTNFSGSPTSNILTTGVASVQPGSVVAGQTYTASVYVQGSSSPTNLHASITLIWLDAAQNSISSIVFTGATPPSTSLTRYSVSGVAPAGTMAAWIVLSVAPTSGTNSGVVSFTQAQLEPNWIPTLPYPLPWCGPSQTNCVQLPNGLWIRQYRKFAGFVIHALYDNYKGNVRTVAINAVGYAWLLSTVIISGTYPTEADSVIMTNILATYLTNNLLGGSILDLFTYTNIITGVTVTSFAANWDDVRTLFDNLASQSGYYWTADYYWNMIYAPPGYFAMPISLICDNSSIPDMITTFPAYNFSAEMDYTQPGSVALIFGSGANTAKVIDGSTAAQNGVASGYFFQSGFIFMRKVNESSLASTADCTQRGIAELFQYDSPRNLYHLTTQVELIAGNSIQITSVTDGLNASTQLLQSVTATWLGTDATFTDVWEYKADLGSANRQVTNILSRLFRLANSNSSATAIATTGLALIERIGVQDAAATGTTSTTYQATVLGDAPLAYYRLGELSGTVADDFSGHAYVGTLHGGITLAQTGLLTTIPGNSMLFNGTTGYIGLPTTFVPTGAHAWSVEGWCRFSSLPTAFSAIAGMGNRSAQQMAVIFANNVAGTRHFILSTFSGDITGTTTIAINTNYHVVGTYDGTQTRLYVNGSLDAGPTSFTMNMVANFASIGADGTSQVDWFPGYIQEAAFYNVALSAAQVLAHYNAR